MRPSDEHGVLVEFSQGVPVPPLIEYILSLGLLPRVRLARSRKDEHGERLMILANRHVSSWKLLSRMIVTEPRIADFVNFFKLI